MILQAYLGKRGSRIQKINIVIGSTQTKWPFLSWPHY